MNRLYLTLISSLCFSLQSFAQTPLEEGFESGTIPVGWSVWNASSHPIFSEWNWTVRATGDPLPGIALKSAVAHAGLRAMGVGFQSGLDTNGVPGVADAWLISPRVAGIQSAGVVRFFASGGGSYSDSLQVWAGTADSLPASQTAYLGTIFWPVGSPYGQFTEYVISLSAFSGQNVRIGFRYNLNTNQNGYFVHLDDVSIEPVASVTVRNLGQPSGFVLEQNYPNPFNPVTSIQFSIPQSSFVRLAVFTVLGQEVTTLVSEELHPGEYSTSWDASEQSSGVYLCRLNAGPFTETRQMVLVR